MGHIDQVLIGIDVEATRISQSLEQATIAKRLLLDGVMLLKNGNNSRHLEAPSVQPHLIRYLMHQ
ncbi:hypothetical protein [Stenotrophomonas maltophilia group sp. RNC7]|uniref:hypothetical protein n=1 Tax=Stenotrophomonas maltophilia group sp. RNC7 TaxID=3071467 RepID=UPI0027E1F7ED|nr:hypothetical protein [Stenotrophomonas maltophilia group sp. RNC7]MDQ4679821.1 hypothetical protein [Stenotrophomonas maltophilia group sp. RNC7]